jgi:hypothetical protein
MLVVVLRHHRSITAAAQALETSRRALRDTMRRLGLYERWQRWQGAAQASKASGSDRSSVDGQSWSASSADPVRAVVPLRDPPRMPS